MHAAGRARKRWCLRLGTPRTAGQSARIGTSSELAGAACYCYVGSLVLLLNAEQRCLRSEAQVRKPGCLIGPSSCGSTTNGSVRLRVTATAEGLSDSGGYRHCCQTKNKKGKGSTGAPRIGKELKKSARRPAGGDKPCSPPLPLLFCAAVTQRAWWVV